MTDQTKTTPDNTLYVNGQEEVVRITSQDSTHVFYAYVDGSGDGQIATSYFDEVFTPLAEDTYLTSHQEPKDERSLEARVTEQLEIHIKNMLWEKPEDADHAARTLWAIIKGQIDE